MLEQNTVLVLGAGASFPYGFPTGAELRKQILGFEGPRTQHLSMLKSDQWHNFKEGFDRSERTSIDSFLGQRTEFREIGTKAIAAVLLRHENSMAVSTDHLQGNWYRAFFNAITEHVHWDEVTFAKVKIITFNYDRSLETFLMKALSNAYGRTEDQAVEKLSTLEIIHFYGRLGSPFRQDSDFLPCGVGAKIDDDLLTRQSNTVYAF